MAIFAAAGRVAMVAARSEVADASEMMSKSPEKMMGDLARKTGLSRSDITEVLSGRSSSKKSFDVFRTTSEEKENINRDSEEIKKNKKKRSNSEKNGREFSRDYAKKFSEDAKLSKEFSEEFAKQYSEEFSQFAKKYSEFSEKFVQDFKDFSKQFAKEFSKELAESSKFAKEFSQEASAKLAEDFKDFKENSAYRNRSLERYDPIKARYDEIELFENYKRIRKENENSDLTTEMQHNRVKEDADKQGLYNVRHHQSYDTLASSAVDDSVATFTPEQKVADEKLLQFDQDTSPSLDRSPSSLAADQVSDIKIEDPKSKVEDSDVRRVQRALTKKRTHITPNAPQTQLADQGEIVSGGKGIGSGNVANKVGHGPTINDRYWDPTSREVRFKNNSIKPLDASKSTLKLNEEQRLMDDLKEENFYKSTGEARRISSHNGVEQENEPQPTAGEKYQVNHEKALKQEIAEDIKKAKEDRKELIDKIIDYESNLDNQLQQSGDIGAIIMDLVKKTVGTIEVLSDDGSQGSGNTPTAQDAKSAYDHFKGDSHKKAANGEMSHMGGKRAMSHIGVKGEMSHMGVRGEVSHMGAKEQKELPIDEINRKSAAFQRVFRLDERPDIHPTDLQRDGASSSDIQQNMMHNLEVDASQGLAQIEATEAGNLSKAAELSSLSETLMADVRSETPAAKTPEMAIPETLAVEISETLAAKATVADKEQYSGAKSEVKDRDDVQHAEGQQENAKSADERSVVEGEVNQFRQAAEELSNSPLLDGRAVEVEIDQVREAAEELIGMSPLTRSMEIDEAALGEIALERISSYSQQNKSQNTLSQSHGSSEASATDTTETLKEKPQTLFSEDKQQEMGSRAEVLSEAATNSTGDRFADKQENKALEKYEEGSSENIPSLEHLSQAEKANFQEKRDLINLLSDALPADLRETAENLAEEAYDSFGNDKKRIKEFKMSMEENLKNDAFKENFIHVVRAEAEMREAEKNVRLYPQDNPSISIEVSS